MSETTPAPDAITDQWGRPVEADTSKLPDGAPAKDGTPTAPSGQGGATPHDGISYQDQWPANPPPSEAAAAKGAENDAAAKGEEPPAP